jgi:uncharacterized membrane protein YhaH (DUF805 family)
MKLVEHHVVRFPGKDERATYYAMAVAITAIVVGLSLFLVPQMVPELLRGSRHGFLWFLMGSRLAAAIGFVASIAADEAARGRVGAITMPFAIAYALFMVFVVFR